MIRFDPFHSRSAKSFRRWGGLAAAALGIASGEESPSTEPPEMRFTKPDPKILKERLTPEQWHVTQECGTEPPFRNAYWDHKEAGIYVDVASGEPLFSSLDKFDSGTGWPSFTQPISDSALTEKRDTAHGMERVEVRSPGADSHLGHRFEDGPADRGGMRYCINSAALRFVPVDRLEREGYGQFLPRFADVQTAVLAGGCFWGLEELLREIPGVLDTEVGYTGGTLPNPTYSDVKTGRTGHAEAVRVRFDSKRLSYNHLLEWFFRMHDPTTPNRQGNDVGTPYRSAIFVDGPDQRRMAEQVRNAVDRSGRWSDPIVTGIVSAGPFYPAEEHHQDYLKKNPGGYTCHYLRD